MQIHLVFLVCLGHLFNLGAVANLILIYIHVSSHSRNGFLLTLPTNISTAPERICRYLSLFLSLSLFNIL